MKEALCKAWRGVCSYLLLMVFVSGVSFVFHQKPEEPEKVYFASIGASEGEELQTEHAEPHNLTAVAEKVTVTSPFGFDIKITEENEEEQSLLHSYSSIGYLTNYNYIEEIEKRKTKFWFKNKKINFLEKIKKVYFLL